MASEEPVYRTLQKHLDKQPVGFPATKSGAELRILKRLFTPEEANLALHLDFRPATARQVFEKGVKEFSSSEQVDRALYQIAMKGGIDLQEKAGVRYYNFMPFIVGMYERQLHSLTPEFMRDIDAFTRTLAFGRELMAVNPPQMRTIPINKSVTINHQVAHYDQIREIINASEGPFVINECICRKAMAVRKRPCKKTARLETCFAMEDMAEMSIRKASGRQIDKKESLLILQQNEDDGLVLQPTNAARPHFVCACCGCCCGMLLYQKRLPRPIDFWPSNFQARVAGEACIGCGKCVSRCQVGAVRLNHPKGRAIIDKLRCIGCGLCVTTCPQKALSLVKKAKETVPPKTPLDLYEQIMKNKKNGWEKFLMLIKMALKIKQSRSLH